MDERYINTNLPSFKKPYHNIKMSLSIDFRTLPISIPSLCIPRVFSNIDEKRIRHIFDELNLGIIERVDIVSKTTEKGEKFNRVFVHFKRWFSNSNADTARERLLNGKEIKIIYDEPWFWKVSAYRPPQEQQRAAHSSHPQKKKPTLQFDDSDNEKDEFGRDRRQQQRPTEKRDRPVQRPAQRPADRPRPSDRPRPRQEDKPMQQREETKKVVVPRSPSSSPPPRVKQENLIEGLAVNYRQEALPLPVVQRRLTKKPSQAKPAPQPLVLEEGEVEEN
jgi:hypothetical protein